MKKIFTKLITTILKVLIIFIFIFPFFWMLMTTFKAADEALKFPPTLFPSKIIWTNYVQAWNGGPFLMYTMNTIIVTIAVIIIQFLTTVPAAYGFAKFNFRGKNLMFSIVLVSFMIPTQLIFVPVYLMLSKWGIMGTLLPQIIPFTASAFGIFLLRQNIMQIPEEIVESAKIDNAGVFAIMTKIIIPMSLPALSTLALFSFVAHWNVYFWPLVMTRYDYLRPLSIGIARLRNTEGAINWPVIMSGNMFLVFPILLIYSFANKGIVRAFIGSGIK